MWTMEGKGLFLHLVNSPAGGGGAPRSRSCAPRSGSPHLEPALHIPTSSASSFMANGNGTVNGNGQHKTTSALPHRRAQPALPHLDEPLTKKFRLFTGAQLDSGRYETRYLILGLLAAGQPGD